MKHLTLTLEEEICLLDRYSVTPNELLVIRVLLILQDDNNEELFRNLIVVLKRTGISLRETLLSLQEKQIILKHYKLPLEGEKFDPYSIPINKNFIKNLYKSSFEMGKELFETYPQFGTIGNSVVALRGVSKKFDSLEQAYFKYGKAINWSLDRHNHIIELLKWANDHDGIINQSLASFIVNNGWLDLEALRNGDVGDINYNAVKML